MANTISYQTITSLGPVAETVHYEAAVSTLQQKAHDNALWIYINGNPVNADKITLNDLLQADEIMLTSKIIGG